MITNMRKGTHHTSPFSLSQIEFPLQGLSPLLAQRVDKAQRQLTGRAPRWAQWVAVRHLRYPAVPTLCIRALAVQIGGITTQAVRLGDAPQFPTFPAKYPHKSLLIPSIKNRSIIPLSWIPIQWCRAPATD